MGMMKRAIGILLTVTILFGGTGAINVFAADEAGKAPVYSTKAKSYKTKNGSALIEAEKALIDKKQFELYDDAFASAGRAVKAIHDGKNQTLAGYGGGIEFNVEVDKAGIYAVWVRYMCRGGGHDSVYFSMGGAEYKEVGVEINSSSGVNYTWMKLSNVSISIPVGESYNVRVRPREQGLVIDKFLITNDPAHIPSDDRELPEVKEAMVLEQGNIPMPEILPPAEHPRVMFRAKDISKIKANLEKEQNQNAYAEFNKLKAATINAKLPVSANATYNENMLAVIQAKAFDYAINANKESGLEAVRYIIDFGQTVSFNNLNDVSRMMGHTIFISAEVYDWCYDLLTEEDKKAIIANCETIAPHMEIGYPPANQGGTVGHGDEAQLKRDLMSFGIAVYDERPDVYNFVAGRFFSEYIEPKNYWFKSHSHHQGDSYGPYRYNWDLWGAWIMRAMSDKDVYSRDMGYVAYEYIYHRRPDGQMFRKGDSFGEGSKHGNYQSHMFQPIFFAANYYGDEYLKYEAMRESPSLGKFVYGNDSLTPIDFLIVNNPELKGKTTENLPLTKYFNSPLGAMIARTGWDDGTKSPDAVAYMKIGERWAGNHNHKDAGSFQIYYKGILASESGLYDRYGTLHDSNYNKQSIASNTILVYDPDETGFAYNVGGQRLPKDNREPANMEEWMDDDYIIGKVLGHEFGPDEIKPEYSYIKGDITKAYSSKVSEALRSMVFMPTDDREHPAVMVVLDKVTSANKAFKKSWLIHMQEEPEIVGNKTIIKRTKHDYNGKLVVDTLLPREAVITKIGGKGSEFMLGDTNIAPGAEFTDQQVAEPGWGRVEVSPGNENETDYFLNVMTVGDADSTAPDLKATLIESDNYAGAIVGDRAVVLSKHADKIDARLSFTLTGNENYKVFVGGLKAGTWELSDGTQIVATEEGGCIYFDAPTGNVTLKKVSADANKTFTKTETNNNTIRIRVNSSFIYSDVDPVIVNDRTLVPVRAIAEAIGSQVGYDDATATATVKLDGKEINITENQPTAYVNGEERTLDVPAMILNDRFVLPIRFVSESLGATVKWDDFAQIVDISVPEKLFVGKSDIPNAIQVVSVTQSGDDGSGSIIENSVDGSMGSYWASDGNDEESAWGIYDLGDVYELDKVHIAFHNGHQRQYKFGIAVSEDGKAYTKVKSGLISSGKTLDFEAYDLGGIKARYVKYLGGGNTVNNWNSMKEIVFTHR